MNTTGTDLEAGAPAMAHSAKMDVRFWRALWHLTRSYWFSEDRWPGRGLLILIIALSLASIWVNVELNTWNGAFYNSLQQKNFQAFEKLLLQFTGWAFLYIVFVVYQAYFNQMLQIRWRRWLTEIYLARWMADATHYRMALLDFGSDNPDQRIAEDFRLFVENTLSLFFGLLNAGVTFISFVGILWGLSGAITLVGYTVPGYMVWAALLYSSFGSLLVQFVGRRLIHLNFEQQHYEADFRFALVRARENTEGIALYRGETDELNVFRGRFTHVVGNWWRIMKQQKRLNWFSSFYGQLAIIFPFLVAAPRYFSGAIQLGGLMQIANAFGYVQGSLSWFVNAYAQVAQWRASVERLAGFVRAMERAKALETHVHFEERPCVALQDTVLELPDGRQLIAAHGEQILPGQHTLIRGPSGSGKSTLFRLISGIWPFAHGTIIHPSTAETLFLPQRPYLPLGSLREVLTYPGQETAYSDAMMQEVLNAVHLPQLQDRLDENTYWAQTLSPGEQQRLALARALLYKPAWLFLDEATSAIDDESERALYAMLRERLPDTTLVSVAHRSGIRRFHVQQWSVDMVADTHAAPMRLLSEPA